MSTTTADYIAVPGAGVASADANTPAESSEREVMDANSVLEFLLQKPALVAAEIDRKLAVLPDSTSSSATIFRSLRSAVSELDVLDGGNMRMMLMWARI